MTAATLIDLRHDGRVSGKRGLADLIDRLHVDEIVDAYRMTTRGAPHRHDRRKCYFGNTRGGRGGSADRSREKVAAKAMFNDQAGKAIGGGIELIDYEVPLRARQTDARVGEIDLVGLETATRRLWIIETKVEGNSETPLQALVQALSYAAILDANRPAIESEIRSNRHIELEWPSAIAIVGDGGYWTSFNETKATGQWKRAMSALIGGIQVQLGIAVRFVDVGELSWHIDSDAKARLDKPLESRSAL